MSYRSLGTVADIANAMKTNTDKLRDSYAKTMALDEELKAYKEFGSPNDIQLIYRLADYVARGRTLEDLLLENLELCASFIGDPKQQ